MSLSKLVLSCFRNITTADIALLPDGINIFCGENGSGKTSLLEAISMLSCGRSFRTAQLDQLIQQRADQLAIYAEVIRPEYVNALESSDLSDVSGLSGSASRAFIPLGLTRSITGEVFVKLQGEKAKLAEIARLLPVRVISPVETTALINAGPVLRRSFLDWGVFHVKHNYWPLMRNFNKLVKQKNAALKARCSQDELIQWNHQFAKLAMQLTNYRCEYFKQLLPAVKQLLIQYAPDLVKTDIAISYYPGWEDEQANNEAELFSLLTQYQVKEREVGYCLIGPHRADIKLGLSDCVKQRFSRGQQKVFAIAMYLAQGEVLQANTNQYPLYLIDDFASELDINSQQLLVNMLSKSNKQVIITALDIHHTALQALLACRSSKLFNIESGKIITK